ncbi:MAG: hypothetical protein AAGK47_04230 [Bacteroidota bacterium]
MQWWQGKYLLWASALILLCCWNGCTSSPTFEQLAQQYTQAYKQQFATDQTAALTIFSPQKIKADLAFCDHYLTRFSTVQDGDFPFDQRQSLYQLSSQLQDKRQRVASYLSFPDRYDIRRPIERTLATTDKTLEEKLSIIEYQMGLSQRYYDAAKTNLKSVQPAAARNAVRLHQKTYKLLDRQLPELVALSTWDEQQQRQFLRYAERAKMAVKDYIGYCRSLSRLPT